jgi:hypothetical protein
LIWRTATAADCRPGAMRADFLVTRIEQVGFGGDKHPGPAALAVGPALINLRAHRMPGKRLTFVVGRLERCGYGSRRWPGGCRGGVGREHPGAEHDGGKAAGFEHGKKVGKAGIHGIS